MEESGLLDITNPSYLFVLYYVFLPRINAAIDSFVAAWNKHPIRIERNWSPEKIWSNELIDRVNGRLSAVADVRGDANIYTGMVLALMHHHHQMMACLQLK